MADEILRLEHVSKLYPGVKALKDVSLGIVKGEIHALVGENGAGKSTMIKIITGAEQPSAGRVYFEGKELASSDISNLIDLGISAVYQEFYLIPSLSIAENIYYGRERKKGIFYDRKAMREDAQKILDELGISLSPDILVKDLSVGYQQLIEIAKAVSRNLKLLILDEPTASLTNNEIDFLFKTIRNLQKKGVTIIYISHRLEEIFELTDRVTIMRDGEYIDTLKTKECNRDSLIKLMVGRELGNSYPVRDKSIISDEVVLEAQHLTNDKLNNVSFKLHKGEILGFAGLVGAGRTETARAIFGADPLVSGTVRLDGKQLAIKSPADAINEGIGLIPEDRKQHGLLLQLPVKENITLSSLEYVSSCNIINNKKEKEACNKLVNDLRIKVSSLETISATLSGGNQQKVVLAKSLATKCKILIFDEPTRGIDVGAKQEIYRLMNRLLEEGHSIIMISSELPELLGMSDRIAVMHEGHITCILNQSEATQELILDYASGKKEGSSLEN